MSVTYTTAAKLSSLLQYTENSGGNQIRLVFDGDSLPTVTEVEEAILVAEDDIDDYTRRSWKENTQTNELHDYKLKRYRGYYYDRFGRTSVGIRFNKQDVITIDGAQGDKIEVWDGNQWIDFVATLTIGSAMYENDYYIDYQRDEVFFFTNFPQRGASMIRLTYRWGETASVPKTIQRAASLLAGADINERYEMFREVSKDTSPAMNLAEKWRERAYKYLDDHKFDEPDVIF